ncbi:MAG: HD domain-containing protein [Anaerolineales bacterium]|nr:HD domain-containing protein [Anaerolineales bacterium]MCB9126327.1 HD domain-containing protein [Ardenticatenales bacterium]MCB9171289.1 HD domain-containing protein [Ardenticatenales bacterium]
MSDLQQRWGDLQLYIEQKDESAALFGPVLEIALHAHDDQRRNDGLPYLTHLLEVAEILIEWERDPKVVLVGLIHDAVRYGRNGATVDEVCQPLADGRLQALFRTTHEIAQYDSIHHYERGSRRYQKMVRAMLDDIDAVIIRLANRLANLRHPDRFTSDQRELLQRSTSDLYLPLLSQLGMWKVRVEVEDHIFRLHDPDFFRRITRRRDDWLDDHEVELTQWQAELRRELAEQGISPEEIRIVPWHASALRRKMVEMSNGDNLDNEQLLDRLDESQYFVTHLVLSTMCDVYPALGAVHGCGAPQVGDFQDYFTTSARYGYAALHTTVAPPNQRAYRVYIRSQHTHRLAQYGVLSRQAYKLWHAHFERSDVDWTGWHPLEKRILKRFINYLHRQDVSRIHVLTPQGDVKMMPPGATALDFAYTIHSEIGRTVDRIFVNGREVPLNSPLSSGDVVHVTRDFSRRFPEPEWEQWVTRDSILIKIRTQLRQRPEARGNRLLEDELRKRNAHLSQLKPRLATYADKQQESLESIYRSIADGTRAIDELLAVLLADAPHDVDARSMAVELTPEERGRFPHWGPDLLAHVVCCTPAPPDSIVGYQSDYGFELHRRTCPNVQDEKRVIALRWKREKSHMAEVELKLRARNYDGLIFDVTNIIRRTNMYLLRLEGYRDGKEDEVRFRLALPIKQELGYLTQHLRALPQFSSLMIDGEPWDAQTAYPTAGGRLLSPYTPTTPIKNPRDLYGREQLLSHVEQHLQGQNAIEFLLLHGPKRIGKTSLLLTLTQRPVLQRQFTMLFVDLQGVAAEDSRATLYGLALRVQRAAERADIAPPPPDFFDFQRQPQQAFERYMERVIASRPARKKLLLILDEFGNLVQAMLDGQLHYNVFDTLRYLSQGESEFSVLFCASDDVIELMQSGKVDAGLNHALSHRLGPLDREASLNLVRDGALSVGVQIDRSGVEALYRITGGHPFYLQRLCQNLIVHLSVMNRRIVTYMDIEQVIERHNMDSSSVEFRHFWKGEQSDEHIVLQALSDPAMPEAATAAEIEARIDQAGLLPLAEGSVEGCLERLLKRLVVTKHRSRTGVDRYQFSVDLFRRWFADFYPLPRPVLGTPIRH